MNHLKDYRITFEKRGRVKYISHLDLNRCMIRAIRRSELPAWYTEGFHPHLYLMFPLALSLGAESICEVMDFRLTEEVPDGEILSRLNASLPEGLKAISVHEPKYEAQHIGSACYDVTLQGENLSQLWNDFISQEQILTEKKTKKGMKEKFWNTLDNHDYELITDKGRYYVKYGNLRYTDKESGADYAVTENTSFKPWWLLSIPALTAIIWFGFLRKRVKAWEEETN